MAGRCVIVPPFSELLEHSRVDTLSSLYVTEDSYMTRVRSRPHRARRPNRRARADRTGARVRRFRDV